MALTEYERGRQDERLLVEFVLKETGCKCSSKTCVVTEWSQLLLETLTKYREATK